MTTSKKLTYISASDYLIGEMNSQVKHEYVDGEVYELAGETRRHNRIVSNFIVGFRGDRNLQSCEI